MHTRLTRIIGLLLVWLAIPLASHSQADDAAIDYARDVQPLLAEYCYACHGPDAQRREAELRLDRRPAASVHLPATAQLPASDQPPAGRQIIVPGSRERSELYLRLTSKDDELRMPPADFDKRPTAEQIERLGRWIDQGAPWRGHWSYLPLVRPAIPQVSGREWPRNPIDSFVRRRLEDQRIVPSAPAEKTRLLRRVTIGLTGLPPTPRELKRFLADDMPNAYQRVVDRLLASPGYGEHMARTWLDLARYADTHGYHIDSHRDMWRWRDWVIDAYNRNMPFDQFTIEQLAGDLLPNATRQQRIASGFNRNTMVNFEGGALPEEYLVEYAADRVVTTSTVWMAQTMSCSRCHDHKYDPFTQRDFFRLFAFFNQVPEKGLDGRTGNAVPFLEAPTPIQQARMVELQVEIARCGKQMAQRSTEVAESQRTWERRLIAGQAASAQAPTDSIVTCPLDEATGNETADTAANRKLKIKGNTLWLPGKFGNGLLLGGNTHVDLGDVAPLNRTTPFSISVWIYPTTSDSMTILARQDDTDQRRGYRVGLEDGRIAVELTRDTDGNAIVVSSRQAVKTRRWQHLLVTYDGSGKAAGLRCYIDAAACDSEITSDNLQASIDVQAPLLLGSGSQGRGFRGLLDELRIYRRTLDATEAALLAGSDPVGDIVAIDRARRSKQQREVLRQYFLENHDPNYVQSHRDKASAESQLAAVRRGVPTTMVMRDSPEPRATYVLMRGDYRYPTQRVTPGTPASLPPLPRSETAPRASTHGESTPGASTPGAPANRLALARWLVSPDHPLTARVAVNRYWQHFFGEGLVRTPDDFGTRGQPPTHPRLLDWLASEFARSGWDRKHLHRLIVTSATYRQSGRRTPQWSRRDPDNRLLARGPRFRLAAETIRDGALFAAGLLDQRVGGPGVYPYQPKGLWKEVSFNPRDFTAQVYTPSTGADLYRRSMYTFWKRAVPPPPMAIFDAPSRETCIVRRPRTNTPLQALVLMNEPGYVEAARRLAQRVLATASANFPDRLDLAFRLVLARDPTRLEMNVLRQTLREQQTEFEHDTGAARQLLTVGQSPADPSLDPVEAAAWTVLASILLNLDETLNN